MRNSDENSSAIVCIVEAHTFMSLSPLLHKGVNSYFEWKHAMHNVRVVKSFKLKQHQEYRYFWSLRHSCMLCVKYGLFLLRQILDILNFGHFAFCTFVPVYLGANIFSHWQKCVKFEVQQRLAQLGQFLFEGA